MELIDHLRKISFVFFMGTGLAHFLSGLLFVNGYGVPLTGFANRILFIPFVLATLMYGLSTLKYNLSQEGKEVPWHNYVFIGIGALVFLGLLAIELFAVDSATPLGL